MVDAGSEPTYAEKIRVGLPPPPLGLLDGSLDNVKNKQTFSSTKLLTRVTVADKLVLVNPF